jgi:hypothetical protein
MTASIYYMLWPAHGPEICFCGLTNFGIIMA